MTFIEAKKITINSSLPSIMPIVSVHSTIPGASGDVTPIDNPTVLKLEANSNIESCKEYPFRSSTPTPTA